MLQPECFRCVVKANCIKTKDTQRSTCSCFFRAQSEGLFSVSLTVCVCVSLIESTHVSPKRGREGLAAVTDKISKTV